MKKVHWAERAEAQLFAWCVTVVYMHGTVVYMHGKWIPGRSM